MRMIKLEQAGKFSEIWLSLAVSDKQSADLLRDESILDYG
jgi:hypothetical protein